MPSAIEPLKMTAAERATLETYARARAGRADLAQRARAMLLLAAGTSYAEITATVGWSSATIAKWKRRFEAERLAGLWGRHKGSKPRLRTPHMEARILNWTRKAPSGATQWSTRSLAKHLHVPHTLVQRVWQRAGLQPHRLERYMRSTDPAFETKAADIIGLYLNPPQPAAVFGVDEKSAIQALDRLDPVLPMSRAVPNATGSSTTGMGRSRCMRHSTRGPAPSSARRRPGTRVRTSCNSSRPSSPRSHHDGRSTSFSTIWRRIKPNTCRRFSRRIRPSICTSRRPTRHGSTRSNSGLRRSNVTSSPAASSARSAT